MKYILELSDTLTQIVYPDYDQIVLVWEADDGIHTRVCTTAEMAKLIAGGKIVSVTRALPSDLPPPPSPPEPKEQPPAGESNNQTSTPTTGRGKRQRVGRKWKKEHPVRTLLREAGEPVPFETIMKETGRTNGTIRAFLYRNRHDFENVEKGLWKFVGSDDPSP